MMQCTLLILCQRASADLSPVPHPQHRPFSIKIGLFIGLGMLDIDPPPHLPASQYDMHLY